MVSSGLCSRKVSCGEHGMQQPLTSDSGQLAVRPVPRARPRTGATPETASLGVPAWRRHRQSSSLSNSSSSCIFHSPPVVSTIRIPISRPLTQTPSPPPRPQRFHALLHCVQRRSVWRWYPDAFLLAVPAWQRDIPSLALAPNLAVEKQALLSLAKLFWYITSRKNV
jgi:hypothetical protein